MPTESQTTRMISITIYVFRYCHFEELWHIYDADVAILLVTEIA